MKIIVLLIVCLCTSCTILKYSISEKIIPKENCTSISIKGLPLIEVEIEDKNYNLIFDAGAMASVVNDSSVFTDFNKRKFATFGTYSGADRKKRKNQIIPVKIKSELFESENKMMLYSQTPKSACHKESTTKGIIGLDAFFEKGLSLLLNFTDSKICNINKLQYNKLLHEGSFKQIKSECRRNQIHVFIIIDGREYKFKVDTGFSGNIVIPFSDQLNFSKYTSFALEGAFYKTLDSQTSGLEYFYENIPAELGNEKVFTKISVSNSIKAQNIGIEFVKRFDWLINYNQNKVYIKRNQNKVESNFKRKVTYYAKVNNDKLEIVVKEKSQTKFNVGDVITIVNGQNVTAENQCELQDLLNKTEDWNSIQIEVISKSK